MALRTFIVIVCTITLASSAEVPVKSQLTFNCLAAYAKVKGISDPAFDDVDYDSSREECVALRHKFIGDIRREIRSQIIDTEVLPKYSQCIYEKLTGSEAFVNSVVKAAALEYSEAPEKFRRIKSSVDTVLEFIQNSVALCKGEIDLNEEFDALFEAQKKAVKNVTDYEEEYCIKKYLIKNNLVDTVLYKVEPNPHSINTTGLNCESLIKKSNDDIYEKLSFAYLDNSHLGDLEKLECALEKFREADYFDLMMKITALTTLDITSEQRINERENFTAVLKKISKNISTC